MGNEKSLNDMTIDELALLLMENPKRVSEICAIVEDVSKLYNAVKDYMIPEGAILDDSDEKNNYDVKKALESISNYIGYDLENEYELYEEYFEDDPYNEFTQELKEKMAYGANPNDLRELCEIYGYRLEEIFDTDTLIELYQSFGYKYDLENDTLSKIERKPQSKEFLEWLEGGEKEKKPSKLKVEEALEDFYLANPDMDDRPDSPIPEWMTLEVFSEAMSADVSINEFGEIIRPLNTRITTLRKQEEELSRLEAEAKVISEAEALISKQNEKQGEQK